ncbi:MAG: right-handed parallel beta-helix repeat-containing protein, partial [Candidatus Latescibacterota bacterium]
MRALLFLLASLTFCVGGPTLSFAATIYITPMGQGDAPNIQAGINSADPGDTILLADGWFAGNGNRDIDFAGKIVVVRSEHGDPANCVIHCEGTAQQPHVGFIFQTGETPDAIVQGVTIQYAWGAGVQCDPEGATEGASPTFRNCRFTNNTGSGLECFVSQPTLIDCVFGYNTGDGVTLNESNVVFDDCVFTSNASAGLDAYGSVTATNCEFSNNGQAGAKVRGIQAEFNGCDFSSNFGGGLISDESELELTNCLVYDNEILGVELVGSDIPQDTTRATLTRCTLWNNLGSGMVVENGEA